MEGPTEVDSMAAHEVREEVRPARDDGALLPRPRAGRAPSLRPSRIEFVLIIMAAIVMGGLGAAATRAQTPIYSSTAQLLVDQPQTIAVAKDEGIITKLSALRFKYIGLATSDRVEKAAAERSGIPYGEVAGGTSASADVESLLLRVTAQANTPEKAQKIAQAVAEQIVIVAQQDQDNVLIPATNRYVFEIVNAAYPGYKVAPTRRKIEVVGVVAALFGAAAVYVLFRLRAPVLPKD